ncbi:MAG TPA: hypothetical protein VGC84_10015 [Ilumatobacteraceae bacterium]
MSFIQIIDCHTEKFDEMQKAARDWEEATQDRRTVRRQILTRDRNDPDHYMIIVFFDTFESAMENSRLPETAEIASKLGSLTSRLPNFYDLDIVDDRT